MHRKDANGEFCRGWEQRRERSLEPQWALQFGKTHPSNTRVQGLVLYPQPTQDQPPLLPHFPFRQNCENWEGAADASGREVHTIPFRSFPPPPDTRV